MHNVTVDATRKCVTAREFRFEDNLILLMKVSTFLLTLPTSATDSRDPN